jgi:multidrug efflux pump subunit AcrA (membrane-fusion protein)
VAEASVVGDLTLTGTVEAENSVVLTSRVMGQVEQLTVREGDRVKAGQLIAQLDVSDLQAQQNQAQAAVNVAQSAYQGAQTQVRQAEAELVEAEAELADAQVNQQRMSQLQADGAVSQSTLDQANTQVAMLQARINRIQASIRQAEMGIGQAQAQIQQAQAGVAQMEANVAHGTVTAPFDGVVTHKQVEIGAMAGAGQPLVTLESVDRLRLSVEVPEAAIAQVQVGQPEQVRLDALNQTIPGTVSQVIPSADPVSRNFTVKISLPANSEVLPGMFGRLVGLSTTERKTLQIPRSALVESTGITGVFTVQNNQSIFHPVTLGNSQGDQVEVFSGVKQGDRIILNPPSGLKENTPLQITPS